MNPFLSCLLIINIFATCAIVIKIVDLTQDIKLIEHILESEGENE